MKPNNFSEFTVILQQFGIQGEKTGWTYFEVAPDLAQRLNPGNKKSFRVKGKLDNYPVNAVALIPMGSGKFIMPVNAALRKAIGKRKGSMLRVRLEVDKKKPELSKELMECLKDQPKALAFFKTLPPSHQHYFSKWVEDAKLIQTKTKRIVQAVAGLSKGLHFGLMIRAYNSK